MLRAVALAICSIVPSSSSFQVRPSHTSHLSHLRTHRTFSPCCPTNRSPLPASSRPCSRTGSPVFGVATLSLLLLPLLLLRFLLFMCCSCRACRLLTTTGYAPTRVSRWPRRCAPPTCRQPS